MIFAKNILLGITFVICVFMVHLSIYAACNVCNQDYYEIGDKYLIKDNLYEDDDGFLYFLKYNFIFRDDRPRYKLNFRKRFFSDTYGDSLAPLLADVIDRDSWQQISMFFFRDKQHLFCTSPFLMDSALIYLEKSNPDSLKFFIDGKAQKFEPSRVQKNPTLENDFDRYSWYATDGSNIFYACGPLDGADLNSFKVVVDDETIGGYAFDKNSIYRNSLIITINKLLDDAQQFAESKNENDHLVANKLYNLANLFLTIQRNKNNRKHNGQSEIKER